MFCAPGALLTDSEEEAWRAKMWRLNESPESVAAHCADIITVAKCEGDDVCGWRFRYRPLAASLYWLPVIVAVAAGYWSSEARSQRSVRAIARRRRRAPLSACCPPLLATAKAIAVVLLASNAAVTHTVVIDGNTATRVSSVIHSALPEWDAVKWGVGATWNGAGIVWQQWRDAPEGQSFVDTLLHLFHDRFDGVGAHFTGLGDRAAHTLLHNECSAIVALDARKKDGAASVLQSKHCAAVKVSCILPLHFTRIMITI